MSIQSTKKRKVYPISLHSTIRTLLEDPVISAIKWNTSIIHSLMRIIAITKSSIISILQIITDKFESVTLGQHSHIEVSTVTSQLKRPGFNPDQLEGHVDFRSSCCEWVKISSRCTGFLPITIDL